MQIPINKSSEEFYDIIILGGGVAGLAAAMTAGCLGLMVLVMEKAVFGGSIAVLESLPCYPGIENSGGWEFTQAMVKQAKDAGCELLDSTDATGVRAPEDNLFEIKSDDGKQFRSRSVIIATGGQPKPLGLEDETRFAQRGIHTCAQCAGSRYKGRGVVVAGNGSWAVEAALHLLGLGCTVTFITGDTKIAGNVFLVAKLLGHDRFRFLGGYHIGKLHGTDYLEKIDAVELETHEIRQIKVTAVFVYRTIEPNINIVYARRNAKGFLLVDENHMTSLPGVFAAGRVVCPDLPIQVLVGDGSKSALSAAAWLQRTYGT